ncbi:hypothetical protein ACVGW1_04615, partial [Enterobacter intestinihominis]
QISGGETACALKKPGVTPWWLHREPPHSSLSVNRLNSGVLPAVKNTTHHKKFRQASTIKNELYYNKKLTIPTK